MKRAGDKKKIAKLLLPAVRGKMGEREYILCAMPVREAVNRIKLAGEITESEHLSEMLQREIDDKRIQPLVDYLKKRDRFFNALVVVMCGGDPRWRNFSNLRGEGITRGEYDNKIGFLSLSGEERMYALDGQHRLMGFKEAVKRNESASSDEIGLLIVHHDEYTEIGRRRSRQLFTALKKYVRKEDKSSIISLDEDDIAAIVVRKLVENSRYADLFQLKKRIHLSPDNGFDSTSTGCFTTIGMLYDCVGELLKLIDEKMGKNLTVGSRPSEDEIDWMAGNIHQYFKAIAENVPEVNGYFREKNARKLRGITDSGSKQNILFRPLGLKCLIDAICAHSKKEKVDIIRSVEICSKSLPFEMSKRPVLGLVWDGGKINAKGFPTLKNTYLHMLGLLTSPKSRETEKRYREFLRDSKASLPPRVMRK